MTLCVAVRLSNSIRSVQLYTQHGLATCPRTLNFANTSEIFRSLYA